MNLQDSLAFGQGSNNKFHSGDNNKVSTKFNYFDFHILERFQKKHKENLKICEKCIVKR